MNKEIYDYLSSLFPNPKSELNYNKDYEFLIAVMLSAQCTDKRVNMVTKELFTKYPSLESLANAPLEDIKTITKPCGFSIKASNTIGIAKELLKLYGGKVPSTRKELEKLPGVGHKTASVILYELYNEPIIAVDTHVSRVAIRLGLASKKDSTLTIEKRLMKKVPKEMVPKMHHLLLLFGRYYCKAINPKCTTCKIKSICKEKRKSI